MCKYCEEGSKLSRGEIQSEIVKDGDDHYIESIMFDSSIDSYVTERVKIYFCPVCGQDLLALEQRDVDSILLSRLGCECHEIIGLLADNEEYELLETLLELSNIKLLEVKTVLKNISTDSEFNEGTVHSIVEGILNITSHS